VVAWAGEASGGSFGAFAPVAIWAIAWSKVNPGSPIGQPWVPDFWGATVTEPEHQEKTCEDITPYGVITQFPKNGRLFTPKYRLITPSTFDHTEKNLFTPSIYKITPS
jgi:hypothetical protein